LALQAASVHPAFLNFSVMHADLQQMEFQYGRLERDALDALTSAEAKAVAAQEAAMVRTHDKAAGQAAAEAAAQVAEHLRGEISSLQEQEAVLRYLRGLAAQVARLNISASHDVEVATAKQHTKNSLRHDAEAAAGSYLGYNMASSSLSYDAVVSFLSQAAGVQRAAESWRAEAELRALHLVGAHLAKLRAATSSVASSRSELKELYSVAGAAGRLVEMLEGEIEASKRGSGAGLLAASAEATGTRQGDEDAEVDEDAVVALAATTDPSGHAHVFNSSAYASPPKVTVSAVRILHGMGVREMRLAGLDDAVLTSPDDMVTVAAHDEELASAWNELDLLMAQVEAAALQLASERAGLSAALEAEAAAQGSASAELGLAQATGMMHKLDNSGVEILLEALKAALAEAGAQKLNGLQHASSSTRSWFMSEGAVAAEVGRLNAQADRLAAGRRVLEAELERRASRDPAARGEGDAATSGNAVTALEQSVSVSVLRSLMETDGGETGKALAQDESALRALLAAGGGTLWHQAAALEDEAKRVDEELEACKAEPSQFRPGCEPRLSFESSRLREEAAKRRAGAAAERAVLEQIATELSSTLKRCRTEGAANKDKVVEGCAPAELAGVTSQLHSVSTALEGRRVVEEDWTQRTELQCLWRHRKLSVSELIAESLSREPAAASPQGGKEDPLEELGEGHRLRRLLQVCSAMEREPLKSGPGVSVLEQCLCTEAKSAHRLLVKARDAAHEASSAKQAAAAAQADAAASAAGVRAAEEQKEEQKVQVALFDYLRTRPEWGNIVSKAMAEEEAHETPSK
jgi:hypothetical protein